MRNEILKNEKILSFGALMVHHLCYYGFRKAEMTEFLANFYCLTHMNVVQYSCIMPFYTQNVNKGSLVTIKMFITRKNEEISLDNQTNVNVSDMRLHYGSIIR